jgi:hypothetical protein
MFRLADVTVFCIPKLHVQSILSKIKEKFYRVLAIAASSRMVGLCRTKGARLSSYR